MSRGITTAIYFRNDDNYSDALLCLIQPKKNFDLYLNGESETVFLNV